MGPPRTPAPHVGCRFFARDGLLVGEQGPGHSKGFLRTEGIYKDFVLRLEVRMDHPTDTVELRVEGEPAHIRFRLNGPLVTGFRHAAATSEAAPTEGRSALQVHPNVPNLVIWKDGDTVRFRNIRVRPLDHAEPAR